MRKTSKEAEVIAICCSDIHLTLTAPPARAKEPDWLAAQDRPLRQVQELLAKYEVPLLCAGDIFTHWNAPPELINWTIHHLPKTFAIPGQHDLPYHDLNQMHKSAFLTLMEAGKVTYLDGESRWASGLLVTAFPFGMEITPPQSPDSDCLNVCLAHQYVWRRGYSYANPPEAGQVLSWKERLKGYDVAIFGDNHVGFIGDVGNCSVFNCGALQRRKIDEVNYHPMVGVIYSNGFVDPIELDCSQDLFVEEDIAKKAELLDLEELVQELKLLGGTELDFLEAIKEYLDTHQIAEETKTILLGAAS